MFRAFARQCLLVASLALAATASLADSTGNAKKNESIAGKASTGKTAPAKAALQRKRYEFTAGSTATAGTAQSVSPNPSHAMPAAASEKSHCHSSRSDA